MTKSLADVPSYEDDKPIWTVTSPPLKLASSCCSQRLVFPCVWAAIRHGTGVPVPSLCKTTSLEGDEKMMPQEQDGKAVTQQPTSKASQGWKNGELWLGLWMSTSEHPLRMGEDHR